MQVLLREEVTTICQICNKELGIGVPIGFYADEKASVRIAHAECLKIPIPEPTPLPPEVKQKFEGVKIEEPTPEVPTETSPDAPVEAPKKEEVKKPVEKKE